MARKDLSGVNDLSKLSAADINEISSVQGENFSRIKTNQIRNVFSTVNKIRAMQKKKSAYENLERELILMKPKLAYAAGRNRDVRPFKDFLASAIDGVVGAGESCKTEALNNFFALIESVVAYHKFYGGKE